MKGRLLELQSQKSAVGLKLGIVTWPQSCLSAENSQATLRYSCIWTAATPLIIRQNSSNKATTRVFSSCDQTRAHVPQWSIWRAPAIGIEWTGTSAAILRPILVLGKFTRIAFYCWIDNVTQIEACTCRLLCLFRRFVVKLTNGIIS
jgi:hypothetical protein